MTCIVAIEHEGSVYMGGDSASSDGWRLSQVRRPKVFRKEEMIFGYSSSFRMGDLLEYSLDLPPQDPEAHHQDLNRLYVHSLLIPAIRECFSRGGFKKVEHSREEGGTFLIGYRGRIYEVSDDFGVTEPAVGYTAVGSGYLVALGSLYTSTNQPIGSPINRITDALRAAEAFTGSVRPPFTVLRT